METIAGKIHLIRGMKVMLDADLAELYRATTKAFNQAFTRNEQRFPPDFMFRQMVLDNKAMKSDKYLFPIIIPIKNSIIIKYLYNIYH